MVYHLSSHASRSRHADRSPSPTQSLSSSAVLPPSVVSTGTIRPSNLPSALGGFKDLSTNLPIFASCRFFLAEETWRSHFYLRITNAVETYCGTILNPYDVQNGTDYLLVPNLFEERTHGVGSRLHHGLEPYQHLVKLVRVSTDWLYRCIQYETVFEPDHGDSLLILGTVSVELDEKSRNTGGTMSRHPKYDKVKEKDKDRVNEILQIMETYAWEDDSATRKRFYDYCDNMSPDSAKLCSTKSFVGKYMQVFEEMHLAFAETRRLKARGEGKHNRSTRTRKSQTKQHSPSTSTIRSRSLLDSVSTHNDLSSVTSSMERSPFSEISAPSPIPTMGFIPTSTPVNDISQNEEPEQSLSIGSSRVNQKKRAFDEVDHNDEDDDARDKDIGGTFPESEPLNSRQQVSHFIANVTAKLLSPGLIHAGIIGSVVKFTQTIRRTSSTYGKFV
ncbi:hypothetical protein BCR39DRAFT_50414 [Naematelia encephala]|uniref:BRCT domain-containing protein n=1 Tax=Naematelia encephala TaxID=71784 RepID=A0A1Y2AGR1_9TREE|nr:hypothetical protein BCR39DRAFT_50414 [Naematelia encephala]